MLFALTGWALLQYFLLPLLFPLVTDKGFTPRWYAVTFGVYGLVLGALVAALRPPEPAVAAATPGPPPRGPWPGGPPPPGQRRDSQAQEDEWSERMRQLRGRQS